MDRSISPVPQLYKSFGPPLVLVAKLSLLTLSGDSDLKGIDPCKRRLKHYMILLRLNTQN